MQNDNFIKRHKLLLISIIFFVVTYILNNIFPPWLSINDYLIDTDNTNQIYIEKLWRKMRIDYAAGGFMSVFDSNILSENRIFKVIPLDILYYGIADIAAAFYYSYYVLMALISYYVYFMKKLFEKLYKKYDIGTKEELFISYFFINAGFYPLCFVMKFIYKLFEVIIPSGNIKLPYIHHNSSPVIKIITTVIVITLFVIIISAILFIIIGIVIPSVVNLIYFFLYTGAMGLAKRIIEFTDTSIIGKIFGNTLFPRELISALIGFITIILVNLLMEKVLEFAQEISIKPLLSTINVIKKQKHKTKKIQKTIEKEIQ